MNVRKMLRGLANILLVVVVLGGLVALGLVPGAYQFVVLVATLGGCAFLAVCLILLKDAPPQSTDAAREAELDALAKRFDQAGTMSDLGVKLYKRVGLAGGVFISLAMMAMPVFSHFNLLSPDVAWFVAIVGFFLLFGVVAARRV